MSAARSTATANSANVSIANTYLAGASSGGQMIKCADIISNTGRIAKHDMRFAQIYLQEKRALTEVLHFAPFAIWHEAEQTIRDAEKKLDAAGDPRTSSVAAT
jgi:hypothetical protein